VKEELKQLFSTKNDLAFAFIPHVFWELMAKKVKCYAEQYLSETKYACGFIWKALICAMLYPQIDHKIRTAWDNKQINSWTYYMGRG
jgi:hypothetical protein